MRSEIHVFVELNLPREMWRQQRKVHFSCSINGWKKSLRSFFFGNTIWITHLACTLCNKNYLWEECQWSHTSINRSKYTIWDWDRSVSTKWTELTITNYKFRKTVYKFIDHVACSKEQSRSTNQLKPFFRSRTPPSPFLFLSRTIYNIVTLSHIDLFIKSYPENTWTWIYFFLISWSVNVRSMLNLLFLWLELTRKIE